MYIPNFSFLAQFGEKFCEAQNNRTQKEEIEEEHPFFKVKKGKIPHIAFPNLARRLIFGYVIKL